MKRWITIIPLAMSLAACAPKSLYQWGGYEDMLYRGYKEPEKMEVMRTDLESHILKLQKSGQKVPPGMASELATLYLQAGNRAKAATYYALERDTWPESRGLMSALIKNLENAPKESAR
ncbi:MAG: hypothetical protein RIQ69_1523 [Pseudomonadota bacterium]|jgi:hypothetical protein